jgi:UDP-glucose 4-epimerase
VHGLPTVVLRYFNVFGPRQSPKSPGATVVPRFIAAALRDEPLEIHGDGLQSRDFTYVDNVVLANCLAADSDRAVGQVFNVACGRRFSLLDVVQALGPLLGGHARTIRWQHTAGRSGDVRHTLADIDKARRLLGYEVAVEFDEGLRRTVAAFQADEVWALARPSMRTTYA